MWFVCLIWFTRTVWDLIEELVTQDPVWIKWSPINCANNLCCQCALYCIPFEVFSLCFFFHLVHNSSVCLTSPLSNHSCTKRVPKRTLQISLHTLFSTLICQWGNHVAWGNFPFPGWLNSLCDIQMARYQVYHYSQRIICSGDNVCRVLVRGL